MDAKPWIRTSLVVLLFAAFLSLNPGAAGLAQTSATATPTGQPLTAQAMESALETAIETVYTQVEPSVVNIQVMTQGSPYPVGSGNSPFAPTQSASAALGSGFVWDMQGHIVTNQHVVDGATSVFVTFSDGTVAPATIAGTDLYSDLAVVTVNVASSLLHPVQVADSSQLKVGQLAIAIGNPYGLQGSLSVGFVSALGRVVPVPSSQSSSGASGGIPDAVQIDTPVNPGNSGGALLDDEGRLIGVTESGISASGSGGSTGVNFAISSNMVQKVVPVLIQSGSYQHPWLGVDGISMQPSLAQAMNLPATQRGALIVDVSSGSPADKAGLRGADHLGTVLGSQVPLGGDVITAIDGNTIDTLDDLITYLTNSTSVGQTVTLTILRGGQSMQVQATLAVMATQ
jgi:serine protease Do